MENASPAPDRGNTQTLSEPGLVRKPFSRTQRTAVILLGLVLAVVIVVGLAGRRSALASLSKTTANAAVPTVSVTTISRKGLQIEVILPGSTQPFVDAAVYARTSGYLRKWYFDIGSHVEKGQLLAEIATPELDQQLKQAEEDLATARQNERLALTTTTRWQHLVADDAVSKQEAEQYESDYKAKQTITRSAAASLDKVRELQAFERIYAPFAGVITTRNTDIGALIDAGAGNPKELFHLAAVKKLRVFVDVPEADSTVARIGAPVGLTLDEYPNRTFPATIERTSDSINPTTRTLHVELDVENPRDEIKTGSYVLAHFKSADGSSQSALTVPANALLFRSEGLQAAIVRNNRAELVPVRIGRDYGSTLEVVFGLQAGDRVIINPSDSLTSGTPIRMVSDTSEAQK